MPDVSIQLQQTINQLSQTLQTLSNSIMSSTLIKPKTHTALQKEAHVDPAREMADRQRIEKALKEGTKALKDTFKSQERYGTDMKITGELFKDAVSKISLKAFDQLPKHLSEITGKQFESMSQVYAALHKFTNYTKDNIKAARQLHERMISLNSNMADYDQQYKLLQVQIEKTGVSIEDLKDSDEALLAEGMLLGVGFNKLTHQMHGTITSSSRFKSALLALGAILVEAGVKALDALQAAWQMGVQFKHLAVQAPLLAMSFKDLAQIQNENLQGVRSSGISLGQFNTMLHHGAWGLLQFTGTLPEGTKLVAQTFHNFRMLSANTNIQNSWMNQTIDVFKLMHITVGETAEQFMQMNSQLLSSQSIETIMYRLNESRRTQTMLEIDKTASYLRTQGLLQHETNQVIAKFAELGAQGPQQRLKEAMQLRAVGGALQLHGTYKLSQMLMLGQVTSREFAKLALSVQKQLHEKYVHAYNTPEEYAQFKLTSLPGVQAIMTQHGPLAQSAIRRGMAQPTTSLTSTGIISTLKNIGPQKTWWNDILIHVVGIDQALKSFFGKNIITTLLSLGGAWTIGKALLSKLGIGKGVAGDAAAGTAEGAGGLGLAEVGMAGAEIGISGIAGYKLGQLLNSEYHISPKLGNLAYNWSHKNQGTPGHVVSILLLKKHEQLMKKYENDAQQGMKSTNKTQEDLMNKLHVLTLEIAKMTGQNPTQAINQLHQTIKNEFREEHKLSQQQIDLFHQQVIDVRTTRNTMRSATYNSSPPQ